MAPYVNGPVATIRTPARTLNAARQGRYGGGGPPTGTAELCDPLTAKAIAAMTASPTVTTKAAITDFFRSKVRWSMFETMSRGNVTNPSPVQGWRCPPSMATQSTPTTSAPSARIEANVPSAETTRGPRKRASSAVPWGVSVSRTTPPTGLVNVVGRWKE